MTAARVWIVAILGFAAVAGAAMWYLQVYAFYEEIRSGEADYATLTRRDGGVELVHPGGFWGIDSQSSPIRFRACYDTGLTRDELDTRYEPYPDPRTPHSPHWFGCFDAGTIAEALASGEARAYLSLRDVQYGVDRVVAVMSDGQAYAWHQINACGEVVFDGEPPPPGCPPFPEGE